MQRFSLLVLALVFPFGAYADRIRVEPSQPDSRSPVRIRVSNTASTSCAVPTISSIQVQPGRIAIELTREGPVQRCIAPIVHPWEFTFDVGVLEPGIHELIVYRRAVDSVFLGLVITKTTLYVRDADAQFRPLPEIIPGDGGVREVRLEGVACQTCTVTVGGVRATVLGTGFQSTIIRVPEPLRGAADIVMTSPNGSTSTARKALRFFVPSDPLDSDAFERVLLPVVFSGPGAYGSEWITELSVHNAGTFVATAHDSAMTLQPDVSVRQLEVGQRPNGYVGIWSRLAMEGMNFHLLARDTTRQADQFGTQIPVVRESDTYDERKDFSIVNVPFDPRYRVALRLYEITSSEGRVGVNIYDPETATTLIAGDKFFSLVSNEPYAPAFAVIPDLLAAFPQLAGKRGRIRIHGFGEQKRYWALVTVTNNETQHVTVLTPQ